MRKLKAGFIYIGTEQYETNLAVPYPSVGSAEFSAEAQYLTERNANGITVRQRISEPIFKQKIGWDKIGAEQWWELTRFFDKHGDAFWCSYFDYTLGEWKTKRFIKSSEVSAQPMRVDAKTGIPEYFTSAGFTIESIGD